MTLPFGILVHLDVETSDDPNEPVLAHARSDSEAIVANPNGHAVVATHLLMRETGEGQGGETEGRTESVEGCLVEAGCKQSSED